MAASGSPPSRPHEIFGTRPEYGEEPDGYPGGHLCYFDPKTGFSRSMGILKRQEGLMGGAIDDGRDKLYYRSEPKNHFLVYDIKTGDVQDRGHVGAMCRYMAIDKDGAVYTVGRGDYLCRYDPQTGYVEDLAVKVEGEGDLHRPYVIAMGPNGKLYGAGIAHPSIMEFDIATLQGRPVPQVTVRNVAPAAPAGLSGAGHPRRRLRQGRQVLLPAQHDGPTGEGRQGRNRICASCVSTRPAGRPRRSACRAVGVDEEKVKTRVHAEGEVTALLHAGGGGRRGRIAVSDGHLSAAERGVFPEADGAAIARKSAMRTQRRTTSILFIVGLFGLSLVQPALRGQEKGDSVFITTTRLRVEIKEFGAFLLSALKSWPTRTAAFV